MRRGILAAATLVLWGCSGNPVTSPVASFAVNTQAVPVIVTVRGNPHALAKANGARFVYSHALQGFAANLSEAAVAALRRNPNVLSVEPDVKVSVAEEWNRDRIDQRGYPLDGIYAPVNNGSGVRAYIVDTGIRYTHSDFGGRASLAWDYSGGDGSDCHGHGTGVAGLLGSSRYGVATGVSLLSVRVLDCAGSNDESVVIAALDWIIANGMRPAVVNMSLSAPLNAALNTAVQNTSLAGFPVVVAAGNNGMDACGYSPSSEASAITVGGTLIQRIYGKGKRYTDVDERKGDSNWGNCVDLFAPGYDLHTTSFASDTTSGYLNGTSAAAPHVSGVAAMVLAANPLFFAYQVDSAVKARATKGVVTNALSLNADMVYAR